MSTIAEALPTDAADLIAPPSNSAPPPPKPPTAAPVTPAPAPDELPGREHIGQKDSRGIEFHPAKFRLKEGKPQIDSAGRFVPLGLGAKPKNPPAPGSAATAATPDSGSRLPQDEPPPAADPSSFAVATGIGIIQTALVLIGDEEGVLTPTEVMLLSRPLKRVLDKYNIGDTQLPCELDLAVAVASLVIVRLQKPKTASRWEKFKAWAAEKWFAHRGRQTAAAVREVVSTSAANAPA